MQYEWSSVQVAPFAGIQFGGSFLSGRGPGRASVGAGLDHGAMLDVRFAESWSVQMLYSRQQTDLGGGGSPFHLTVERLMAGVAEEQGEGPTRFFGVALLGATRFVGPAFRDTARRHASRSALGWA